MLTGASDRMGNKAVLSGDKRVPAKKVLSTRLLASMFPVFALVFAVVFFRRAQELGFGKSVVYPLVMMTAMAVLALLCMVSAWWPGRGSATGPATDSASLAAGPAAPAMVAEVTAGAAVAEGEGADLEPVSGADRGGATGLIPAVTTVLGLLGFLVLIHFAGMIVAACIFLVVLMVALGYRKPIQCVLITAGVAAGVWLIFEKFLLIELPRGVWGL